MTSTSALTLSSAGDGQPAAAQINGAGNGNQVFDLWVFGNAHIQQTDQTTHAPAHQRDLFAAGMTPHFGQSLSHHHVRVVLHTQMGVLLFRDMGFKSM